MAKDLNLTVGERLSALKLLQTFKGNMFDARAIFADCKTLGISEEEQKSVNFATAPAPDGVGTMATWDEGGSESPIAISQVAVDYLLAEINKLSESNQMSLGDTALMDLHDKLSK